MTKCLIYFRFIVKKKQVKYNHYPQYLLKTFTNFTLNNKLLLMFTDASMHHVL
jgi:hypothetical protein